MRLAVLATGVGIAHLLALQALMPAPRARGPSLPLRMEVRPIEVAAFNAGVARVLPQAAARQAPTQASSGAPGPLPAPQSAMTSAASSRSPPAQAPTGAVTVQIAPTGQLDYAVTGQTQGQAWQGQAQLTWRLTGDHYEAGFESDSGGMRPRRRQHSAGRVTAQGLVPERYAEQGRTLEVAHLDAQGERIVFSANRPPAPRLPDAQDRLSVLLQLGALIAAQPAAYGAGRLITLQTATTREADPWQFRVDDEDMVDLPGGPLQALRLVRQARHAYDPQLVLWLAPRLDYALVRLKLTQADGDGFDLRWTGSVR